MFSKIISIGHRCTSQIAINYISQFYPQYGETSPFSWVSNFNVQNILNIISTDFSTYLSNSAEGKYYLENNLHNKQTHGFIHYNLENIQTQQSFFRKIDRFRKILNDTENRVLFVYINEDFIYNEDYRSDYFNNYNNLIKLHDYLVENFPKLSFKIFNIVFFDTPHFKNIYNIYYNPHLLIIKKHWHNNLPRRGKLEETFRNDCGKLLHNFLKNCS